MELYPASTDAEASKSQKEFASDMRLISTYKWAVKFEETSKIKIYTYIFTHQQPGETKEKYLVFHSSDLPYVFDNLNQSPRPWTEADRKIAEQMSDYWVNFISTGDPNEENLPNWSLFVETNNETTKLGDRMGMRPIVSEEKFEILNQLTPNRVF